MKKITTILFILTCFIAQALAQEPGLHLIPFDINRRLELKLLDSEVVASSKGFNLKISITNRTDSVFILYGFKDTGCAGGGADVYRKPNITVGAELNVIDRKNNELCIDIDGERQQMLRPVSRTLYSWKDAVDLTYKTRIVVQANSTENFAIPIKLFSRLKKGTYKLRMLYYSGVNAVNIIDEKTIMKDQRETGGVLFQGYSESNFVKLIFK